MIELVMQANVLLFRYIEFNPTSENIEQVFYVFDLIYSKASGKSYPLILGHNSEAIFSIHK